MGGVVVALISAATVLTGLFGQSSVLELKKNTTEQTATALPVAEQAQCLKARGAFVAGAVPQSDDFVAVDCPKKFGEAAFRYEAASKYVRLSRDVTSGEIVAAYPDFATDMVRPGQKLELVIAAGAARVERDVEALQAALPGHRLFVKASDGEVFSVRYEGHPQ